MSETTDQTVESDGPGIREILERMDGGQPTNLLPDDPPPRDPPQQTAREDAESVADQLRRDAEAATARARASEQREAQERQARQRSDAELQRTRQASYEAEYSQVTGLLAEREEEAERLQAEHSTAADAGDHKRMAQIAYRLGKIGAEVTNLNVVKGQFENDRGNALRQPAPSAPPPAPGEWTTVGMSRELFLNGDASRNIQSRSEATKAFLRENDDFFTNPDVYNAVMGAHSLAIGRGAQQADGTFRKLTADSPEYFRFIREQAGMSGTRSQSRGSSAPPSAPPSRDAVGPSGRARNGDLHISAEQRRAAEWMMKNMPGGYKPEDAQAYAIEQAELQRRGDWPFRRR